MGWWWAGEEKLRAGPRPRHLPVAAQRSVRRLQGGGIQGRHRCADEGSASQELLGSRMELRDGTMSRALGALAGRVGAQNRTEAEAQVSAGQQEREYGSS